MEEDLVVFVVKLFTMKFKNSLHRINMRQENPKADPETMIMEEPQK